MQHYIARRCLLAVPTLFGITVIIFVAMRILPGDTLGHITTEEGTHIFTDEEVAAIRKSLGLDRPLYVQYLSWMADVFKGELGYSFWRDQEPIRDIILRRLPVTGQIAALAVVLSWLIGLPVGVIAAVRRNSLLDYFLRFVLTLFLAIPGFWMALAIVLFTVLVFSWRPPLEIVYLWDDPVRSFQLTILPAVVFAVHAGAVIARLSRATLLEVLREDYVRTARAKGMADRVVVWRHALKNALLPVITVAGLQFAAILGGSVVIERAFAIPGLGYTFLAAMGERDWMVIQNLTLFFGVVYITANLAIDLTYAWIDPRIRYQ